ncbi:hypothetical protein COOONC_17142, partial [Cooperia oncophora]
MSSKSAGRRSPLTGVPRPLSPHSTIVVDRASQLPSLGQTSPDVGVATPNEPNALEPVAAPRRVSLWTTQELNKLADLVERHRDASGRIRWRNLAPAWERLRSDNEPPRTTAALRAAYAKLARNTGHAVRNDAMSAQRAAEASEEGISQPQEDRNGQEPVSTINAGSGLIPGTSNVILADTPEEIGSGNTNLETEIRTRFRCKWGPLRGTPTNLLSEELQRIKSKSLTSLNAAVYAVAKAVTTKLIEENSERLAPMKERFQEAAQLRNTLISFISTLAIELRRRRTTVDGRSGSGRPSRKYLEISRLYRVSKTADVQRLLIRFRDELNIVKKDIKLMEEAKNRFQVRRRGPPFVAREPRETGSNVPVDQVREYWKPIVGEVQPFRETVELRIWSQAHRQSNPNHVDLALTDEDWKVLFSRIKPWKATGPDGIQGFWWKYLPEAKERLKEWCIKALHRRREVIPRWLCRGRVVLIPKGKSETPGPGDFRPIACLNTCYKVLTAMIANRITAGLGDRLPREQVALRRGIWGCTHAHILDQTIRNGLMQGDTLSPLLFCMAIAPISGWLRSNIEPYKTRTGSGTRSEGSLEVGHIFYMDDLKVYTTNWADLVKAKAGIQKVAEQLGLRMNPSKCAVKSVNTMEREQTEVGDIPILGSNSLYKYLGAEQGTLVSMRQLWNRVRKNAWDTAVRIMNSDLTVRQKVAGYNQTVIPKLKYAASCVIFGMGRLVSFRKQARDFDVRIRKLLEESRMRFGYSCVARLYVRKEDGGLGLKSIEEEVDHTIVYTWCYLASNPDFIVPYQLAESLRASSKRSLTSDFKSVLAANGLEDK